MSGDYRRLPGRALITLSWKRGSLWMGPDHLLMAVRRGYTQEYKRFYFQDIQALHLRTTSTGAVLGYSLGAITGICLLLLWLGWMRWIWDEIWLVLWGIVTGFWIFVLSYHLVRGGTCECFIQTAVHLEPLISLKRLRPSLKTFRILRDRIEEVQGTLDAPAMETLHSSAPAYAPPPSAPSRPVREYQGGAHAMLFSVLMLSGFLTLSNIFFPSQWIYVSGYFLFAAILVLVLLSLIRQHSANLPAGLKAVTGISLLYLILFASVAYILVLAYAVENPGLSIDYWQLFRRISVVVPRESVPLLLLHIFSVVATWSLGITGMFLLSRFRSKPLPPLTTQPHQKSS